MDPGIRELGRWEENSYSIVNKISPEQAAALVGQLGIGDGVGLLNLKG